MSVPNDSISTKVGSEELISTEIDALSEDEYEDKLDQMDGNQTLTKADLVEELSLRVGLNKRESRDLVNRFFDEIRRALADGQEVRLSRFGNFILRNKAHRPGRNLKTGEMVVIEPRRVVAFQPSLTMRQQVQTMIDGKRRTES